MTNWEQECLALHYLFLAQHGELWTYVRLLVTQQKQTGQKWHKTNVFNYRWPSRAKKSLLTPFYSTCCLYHLVFRLSFFWPPFCHSVYFIYFFIFHLLLPFSLFLLMLFSSAVSSLMETSFMADSKCICGVPRSSVREISAERITLAFSTDAVLWLTFDGEINRGCKFNHSGRLGVHGCVLYVCVYAWIWVRPGSVCLNANSGP